MKNKKILVPIIISMLIITLVLTLFNTKIIKKSIAEDNYESTTEGASSTLIAKYIKKGVKVGGIEGTLEVLDTSDANAVAEDILWGKTAYVKGEKVTGTFVDTVALGKTSGKTFDENTMLTDDYGNTVIVPAGFKIADDSATDVTKGVVIEDTSAKGNTGYTKGSQFVWIPIGNVTTNNEGDSKEIKFARYDFTSDPSASKPVQLAENYSDTSSSTIIESKYQELTSSTYGNTTAENLSQFISGANKNKGFYIGRYEAGDETAKISERVGATNVSNTQNPVVVKKGVYPYNYVNQGDASRLCREMYTNDEFVSDLINSYAWDTAIAFIQTFSGDNNYSQEAGKNTGNILQKCGESILSSDKKLDVRCNIYDMAGNAYEFTTETYKDSRFPCSDRGGCYTVDDAGTGHRDGNPTNHSDQIHTFRPIIYLN